MIRVIILALLLAGCATAPEDITSSYVSPTKYSHLDCMQLSMEADNILRRRNALHGDLDEEASEDAWATGIGMVVFWPALFFIEGDDEVKQIEYARLKGEYEAIQTAIAMKKCGS